MKAEVLQMFEKAYRDRFPLFGSTPTQCVVRVATLLPSGAHIIDLGSGDGRDSLYLLGAGFRVTALDLCPSAIERLRHTATERGWAGSLSASVGDVTSWKPSAACADAVVGITVLDHLAAQFHADMLQSIDTAVRQGGYVALEMHSDRDPSVRTPGHGVSEFQAAICSVAREHLLIKPFLNGWRILEYSDRLERDTDHGEPHYHGFCTLVAQKEESS